MLSLDVRWRRCWPRSVTAVASLTGNMVSPWAPANRAGICDSFIWHYADCQRQVFAPPPRRQVADVLATHNRISINAQVAWAQVVDSVCHSFFGAILYAQIASHPIRLATAILAVWPSPLSPVMAECLRFITGQGPHFLTY